jgi:hypothetical protein
MRLPCDPRPRSVTEDETSSGQASGSHGSDQPNEGGDAMLLLIIAVIVLLALLGGWGWRRRYY